MNRSELLFSKVVLYTIFCGTLIFSQVNQIVNGSFATDSGWALGRYNDGSAERTVEDNAYVMTIDRPGTELWSVQLTQSGIHLRNGAAYVLTFDISASLDRTVEVTVSRNGGDYVSYSGRDTVAISPTRISFHKMFIMKQATDNDARIEFNCGRADGTIALRNVALVEFTDKVLELENPKAGEEVHAGEPYEVTWSAVNVSGQLAVRLSTDNGGTWRSVGTVPADSGRFEWIPDELFSPWCRLQLQSSDSPAVSSMNAGTFEIVPVAELLKNGSFANAREFWNLGAHSGRIDDAITSYGGYQITILESGTEDWNIQLTQDNVALVNGKKYRYSFLAYSDSSSTVDVNIGMSHDPYESYLDSASRHVTLSPAPARYSFVFTMNAPSDSSARFEVNCGKASGVLFFDDFSMIPEYVAPVRQYSPVPAIVRSAADRSHNLLLFPGNGASVPARGSIRLFDLQGRTRSVLHSGANVHSAIRRSGSLPFGVYIVQQPVEE